MSNDIENQWAAILKAIMPSSGKRCTLFALPIYTAMTKFQINTPARQAAFLAQIAHESGSLVYTREIASGAAYEGRKDLGNVTSGDGKKFRGRGLIQITGRANYVACSQALYGDRLTLTNRPELLELPRDAAMSAAWFWQTHGLNELADKAEFDRITKRINGGQNGREDRRAFWAVAKHTLGVEG